MRFFNDARFLVLLVFSFMVLASPALADYLLTYLERHDYDDGSYTTFYEKTNLETGQVDIIWFHTDVDGVHTAGTVNPTPDDPSSGMKGDYSSALILVLQSGGPMEAQEVDFWQSVLGKALTQTGSGDPLGEIHNPSDADNDTTGPAKPAQGATISDDMARLIEQDIEALRAAVADTNWYQINGGSASQQLKNKLVRGGPPPGGGGGDDGGIPGAPNKPEADDPTGGDGPFEDLPGPPELVNPNPVARAGGAAAVVSPTPPPAVPTPPPAPSRMRTP